MELSEKKWSQVNKFFREHGTRTEIENGVEFTHPKMPFIFRCLDKRVERDRDPFDVRWYRHFLWVGDGWTARRSYVTPLKRESIDGPQTAYTLEGDIEQAESDMVLALLSTP